MAFRDAGESAKTTPRPKPRRSSSQPVSNRPVGVLAPKAKPTGVFAQPRPKRVTVSTRAETRSKVRAAEERLPGTTAPVKRFPDTGEPTRAQAKVIVRSARQALKGLSVPERERALSSGDRVTRQQLTIAARAQGRLDRDQRVRVGLNLVRARPEAFGLGGATAAEVRKPVRGRLPSPVRGALAHIGAEVARQHPGERARERAPHGLGAGASLLGTAAIHPDFGTAASAGKVLGSAVVSGAIRPVARALRATGAGSDENALKNFANDAIHFPYDAVNSAVETGAAAVDLAHGDTKAARRIVGALDDGVVGALLGADPELALKRFGEHPLYGALEVTGAGKLLSRGAGAVGRSGALGEAVREGLSTERPNLRSSRHGGVEEQRSYSKGAVGNRVEKALDERMRRRGLDPDVASNSADLPLVGSKSERMLRRAANEEVSASEDLRRADVQSAGREAAQAVRGGNRGPAVSGLERTLRDLTAAAAEGKLGARVDLHAVIGQERQRLATVYAVEKGSMTLAQRRATLKHQKRLKVMEEVVRGEHGEEVAAKLFERAGAYRDVAARQTQELVDLKALAPGQADAARLRTFAVTRMGATDDPRRAPTEADVAVRQAAVTTRRAAKVTLRRVEGELGAAKEELAAARAVARGGAARRRAAVVLPGERLGRNRAESVTAFIKRVEDAPPAVRDRLVRGERADARKVASAQARVKAAKGQRRSARQAVAAVKVPGARKFRTGLVLDDGRGGTRKLTLNEIKTTWEREHPGEPLPAFVSHVDRSSEAARFVNHTGPDGPRRMSPDAHRRTGEAARRGTAGVDERSAVDSVMHTQGVVTAVGNFDRLVQRFGSKREDGRMFTPQEAELAARSRNEAYNAKVPGEVEWVPVKATPGKYDAQRIEEIGAAQAASRGDAPVGLIPDQLKALEAGDIHDPGARNVVLMPRTVVDQIRSAQSPTTSEAAKTMQAFTNVFRGTVLPTSTKWLFGNAAEMALRLALHQGPMALVDVKHGMRLQKAIEASDAAIGRQLKVRTRGGGVYGSSQRLGIHRNASMFNRPGFRQGAALASGVRDAELQKLTARDLGIVGKVGPKMVFDGYTLFANTVIRLNKALEEGGQAAVVGKMARREAQEMTGSWARSLLLQGKTFEALVAGDRVKSVEWATKAAREIDKTLGKYNRFSPEMRRLTQTLAPFLPWYLNAARFVYWTLPVENTVKAALLARVEATFEEDMEKRADSLPPGDLGANPQRSDGGIVPVSRYTPFGAFTAFGRDYESVLQEAASPILPQLSTPLTIAVFGENFAHRPLKKEDGTDVTQWDRARMAAYSLFESVVPFTQIGRRLLERGDTGYDDSTVVSPKRKPGTSHDRSSLDRIFVPWSPTYLGAEASSPARTVGSAAPAPRSVDDEVAAALAGPEVSSSDSALDDEVARALAGP